MTSRPPPPPPRHLVTCFARRTRGTLRTEIEGAPWPLFNLKCPQWFYFYIFGKKKRKKNFEQKKSWNFFIFVIF